jgi:hypothetical protein
MSAATTDQARITIEEALAWLVDADDRCRVAMLRLSQWAKTEEEGDILQEVFQARRAVAHAKQEISKLWTDQAPSRQRS